MSKGNSSSVERLFARPRFVSLIGIDGSGKTTQAMRLAQDAGAAPYPPRYVWCRYSRWLSVHAIRLARALSGKRGAERYAGEKKAKSNLFRRKWIAATWTYLTFIEYWFQVAFRIGTRKLIRRSMICDRYLDDALADLATNLGSDRDGTAHILRNPILRLYPKPDATVYLRISAETSVARKNDPNVPAIEYLRERVEVYDALAELQGHATVNGEQPPEDVYREIVEALRTRLDPTGGGGCSE